MERVGGRRGHSKAFGQPSRGRQILVVGAEVKKDLVPEHSRRHVLPDSALGVVGSGRATEPDEDVPAAVVHTRNRGAREKARD